MPGKGKYAARAYTPGERKAIESGLRALGVMPAQAFAQLGEGTFDIYLNGAAYWRNVPARVWEYTLGGYQVLKKWLSYREKALLGRDLTLEEIAHVTNMARRIAAILLMEGKLDENYKGVKEQ